MFLASIGIASATPFGKWWAPLLPLNLWGDEGLHVVHGKPIPCPQLKQPGNPSKQEVDDHQKEVEDALADLYRRNAPKFYKEGTYNAELEMWPRDAPFKQ